MECYIRDKHKLDSKELEERVKALIPGNIFATIHKDVVIKLNGIKVSDSNGLYPYVSSHLILTKIHPVYRKASEVSGQIYYDNEGLGTTPGETDDYQNVGPMEFKDLFWRHEKFQIGNKYSVDFALYLFTDLTAAPTSLVLPPSVTVEIELHPNSPQKSIVLDKIGIVEPVVVISKA